ncbi:MAG: EstA family serine hydrolase [Moraxellaceae bacterium]|nr:MAG: EstA family serine hydrolase [Moraxellaceae bacterium]
MASLPDSSTVIHGTCDPEYIEVKQQFERNMASGSELGAAVAIMRHGTLVVDLWAGYTDKKQTTPWERDSIVAVFSATKGVTSLCVQHAIDNGLLDVEKKTTHFWPEFGRNGKKDIPVAWLLCHKSGLAALRDPVEESALFDWEYMVGRFAEERPWWKPGSTHGYHMVSSGWLIGEVFKRALGCSVGEYLRNELAPMLGMDFHLGLPDSEFSRVAQLRAPTEPPAEGRIYLSKRIMADRESLISKALLNPPTILSSANWDEWRRLELPSASGHGNARALATLYGAAVNNTQFISEQALQRCTQEHSSGMDYVLEIPTRFGPGFMLQQLDDIETGFGTGQRAFGHPGSGGSLGFADPEKGLGFGYVMNQMGSYAMVDPRARSLVDALYRSIKS